MKDFSIWIPVVNRLDLLDRSVDSARDVWSELTVIDNSLSGIGDRYPSPVTVFRPPVPLSCPQAFNYMMEKTRSRGQNICVWMHSDAAAHDGSCLALIDTARRFNEQGRKWGVLFTAYDALSAINADMLDTVGRWDTFFWQYFCDSDYYHRVRVAGYECIDTGIGVDHEPSRTINSDDALRFMNGITFPLYLQYFTCKWGGEPGRELFTIPFGRKLDPPENG